MKKVKNNLLLSAVDVAVRSDQVMSIVAAGKLDESGKLTPTHYVLVLTAEAAQKVDINSRSITVKREDFE